MRGRMTTNREKVLALRQENPQMRAIMIAEELGITRERVRQLLVELDLRTDIPEAPTKRTWSMARGRGERKPKPVVLPKPDFFIKRKITKIGSLNASPAGSWWPADVLRPPTPK